ncbi:hypothetical protein Y032_0125g1274 [Ancylostoma ceylanicum]|nr:hypothetical protein Y032_0125g1274 [Ancylostoma ceylanicum]
MLVGLLHERRVLQERQRLKLCRRPFMTTSPSLLVSTPTTSKQPAMKSCSGHVNIYEVTQEYSVLEESLWEW